MLFAVLRYRHAVFSTVPNEYDQIINDNYWTIHTFGYENFVSTNWPNTIISQQSKSLPISWKFQRTSSRPIEPWPFHEHKLFKKRTKAKIPRRNFQCHVLSNLSTKLTILDFPYCFWIWIFWFAFDSCSFLISSTNLLLSLKQVCIQIHSPQRNIAYWKWCIYIF